jgi:hypothetical protein
MQIRAAHGPSPPQILNRAFHHAQSVDHHRHTPPPPPPPLLLLLVLSVDRQTIAVAVDITITVEQGGEHRIPSLRSC